MSGLTYWMRAEHLWECLWEHLAAGAAAEAKILKFPKERGREKYEGKEEREEWDKSKW